MELAYDELRIIAHRHLHRSRQDATLRTTALVNILIDYARQRQASLRREGEGLVPEEVAALDAEVVELLAVEAALARLADLDDRLARVVECRFFGGLTSAETAEAPGVSRRTVDRDWTRARTHLHRNLRSERRAGI